MTRHGLLRAHVFQAWELRGCDDFDAALDDVVDGWELFPAVEAALALEEARAGRRDIVAEGLAALRESKVTPASPEQPRCHLCQREIATGDWCPARVRPDCIYHARLRLGISERWAGALRAQEWTELIEQRRAA